MTSIARTLSSKPSSKTTTASAVRLAVEAVVAVALAGWRSTRTGRHAGIPGIIDDHTLRDVGIHRLDLA